VIYGSIETLTGGYLDDRRLLDRLVSRGDRAEVISLPRRNHYPRALCDNASHHGRGSARDRRARPRGLPRGVTRHLRLFCADRALLLRMRLAARRGAARHPTWGQSFEGARSFLHFPVETHRCETPRETTP
jgi:hypothetical protein